MRTDSSPLLERLAVAEAARLQGVGPDVGIDAVASSRSTAARSSATPKSTRSQNIATPTPSADGSPTRSGTTGPVGVLVGSSGVADVVPRGAELAVGVGWAVGSSDEHPAAPASATSATRAPPAQDVLLT